MLHNLNDIDPDIGSGNHHGLPLTYCGDIKPILDGQWRIKNILPRTGFATIYGHPGTAKTFLALEWSLYIALGWDWNGHKVEKGAVVYIGAEGRVGLHNRISAFLRHHCVAGDEPAFALIASPIDLLDPRADTPKLVSAIREAANHLCEEPALVIIDTLSKTFGGGDENGKDMAQYVSNCERVSSEFDCCVMPVHHRPKESANSQPRGHGSLRGGLDSIFLVEGTPL
ncbi:MAG: AAA family ATPase [Sphingomonadales bacterium]|nr:AAA family ATPase [Sphingomonadales bacterium]